MGEVDITADIGRHLNLLTRECVSMREEVTRLRSRLDARTISEGLFAAERNYYDLAEMTPTEAFYFEKKGAYWPAALIRLSDWWRRYKAQKGLGWPRYRWRRFW